MPNPFVSPANVQLKAKFLFGGISGSGKTMISLAVARQLGKKIAVIDTENDSASRYFGIAPPWDPNGEPFKFDRVNLGAPYSPERYIELMKAAYENGFDVVVIDSTTHEWTGEGGILSSVDKEPSSQMGWKKSSPRHTRFLEAIMRCPIHLVATVRYKDQYVIEADERGKHIPRKIGLGAIQRDQFEYEFDAQAHVDQQHKVTFEKTRFPAIDGVTFDNKLELLEAIKGVKAFLDRGDLQAGELDLRRLLAVATGNEMTKEDVIELVSTNFGGRTPPQLKASEIQDVINLIIDNKKV